MNTNYSARNKENLKNKAHWCVWNRPDSIKDMTSSAALHQNFTHFMVEIEEAKLAIFDTTMKGNITEHEPHFHKVLTNIDQIIL